MWVLRYIGSALMRFIEIAVTLAVFHNLQARDIVLIVAVLGMIYTSIRAVGIGFMTTTVGAFNALAVEIMHIRGLLDDQDLSSSALRDYIRTIKSHVEPIPILLQMGTLAIIWFICLFQIFRVF